MKSTTVLTVTQLNTYIKSLFEGDVHLSSVYLVGEISNFTNHYRTGHFYFTIKDDACAIKAVMFRSNAQRLRFLPENGMRVLLRGRVSVFERDGQYQLYVDDMQPDGVGALTVAFEQLKTKLEEQGLFAAERKKPIPPCPARVGVITSPTGAAVRDLFNVLGRRFPLAKIVFHPVQVQGASAAGQIAAAIDLFNQHQAADVLIIGRGGGSMEDLWAFNEEIVALAISRSTIPIISAVGHETDFTISDFVADLRAPTPSAAAELAVPEQQEQYAYVSGLKLHAISLIKSTLADEKQKLAVLTASPVLKNPHKLIENEAQTLDSLWLRLNAAQNQLMQSWQRRLAEACAKLDALSPYKVLLRGYAAVYDGAHIVDSVRHIDMNKPLRVRFADGSVECQPIKRINEEES